MRKYFNILLVLVVVLAVSMVACKKVPTAVADFSTEEVSPPPAPSDEVKNETVKPEDTIDTFNGRVYNSGGQKFNVSGEIRYYTASIKDGKVIIETYNDSTFNDKNNSEKDMIFNVSGSGTSYNLTPESKNYNIVIGGDVDSVGDAKATFKDGGYLTIVFKWGGSYAETTFTVKSK